MVPQGELTRSSNVAFLKCSGYEYILVVVEGMSKWVEVVKLPTN